MASQPNSPLEHSQLTLASLPSGDTELLKRIRHRQARIAILGMGHVGLPTALSLCEMGWQVIGADSSASLIELLRKRKVPFYEPGLQELLEKHLGKRFHLQEDLGSAIRAATILFICVGTPQRENGEADLSQVESVARTIAANLCDYKLVIEKSTVPAITAQWVKRTIQRYARNGDGNGIHLEDCEFDVASSPEFLQEGSALENLRRPERIVVGAESQRARKLLEELYSPFKDVLLVTGTSTAELIKHSANSFLAMKISFINMVADLCEAVGADVTQVAKGIGSDPRIGPDFLHAGIGFGGYCFPKDLRAFIHLAEEYGLTFSLLREVSRINDQRTELFVKKLRRALWVLSGKTIAVLGLAFKAGTDDTRESPSLRIVQALLDEGAVLRLHDPKAVPNLRVNLPPGPQLEYCDDPYTAAKNAQALLILTDWPEYKKLEFVKIRSLMDVPLLLDGRNLLDPKRMQRAGFEYYSVGR